MITRSFVALFILALLFVPLVKPAYSQASATDDATRTESVRKKVKKIGTGEKAKVKVALADGSSLNGYISQSSDTDLTVVEKSGASRTVKYSDVAKISRGGNSRGAMIGAIALVGGIAAGILIYLSIESRR